MSATRQPLWATPDDGVQTETSLAQLDVEQSIAELLLPFHTDPVVQGTRTTDGNAEAVNARRKKTRPSPPPMLQRAAHIAFLSRMLEPLPGAYVAFDSNRSWILYWVTHSYDLLRTALGPRQRAQAIATLLSFQSPTGGFGGGPNQLAHLMSTYPAICALAIVGGPGPAPTPDDVKAGQSVEVGRGGWDAIDKQAMYNWMMSLKQPDGSFVVHEGGEVDVRASYCVSCISLLLGICTPELVKGMQDFIVSCQTYEGGLAAASQSNLGFGADSSWLGPQPQLGEAHGGYAHCALASYLSLIALDEVYQEIVATTPADDSATSQAKAKTQEDKPPPQTKRLLDLDALLSWATAQQGLAIEMGAMRGRTNKLVDGCYSWFAGSGLFTVLDACLVQARGKRRRPRTGTGTDSADMGPAEPEKGTNEPSHPPPATEQAEEGWTTDSSSDGDEDGSQAGHGYSTAVTDDWLFDPIALQEYILIAAQTKHTLTSGSDSPADPARSASSASASVSTSSASASTSASASAAAGGLRDKPGKKADAYHTCYNLSGLSLCQHRIVRSEEAQVFLERGWKPVLGDGDVNGLGKGEEQDQRTRDGRRDAWLRACYVSALAWLSEPPSLGPGEGAASPRVVGDPKTNTVVPTHPLFNLTFPRVKGMMDWAYRQQS